jgi:hypothetical protein
MPRRKRIGEEMVLAAGEVLRGERDYRVLGYLGRGGFAAGYRVEDLRGTTRFLKEFLPAADPRERPERENLFLHERRILAEISGYELCPTLHDAFTVEGLRYLVLDFIPGEDLEARLDAGRRVSEERLLRWSVCLCSILGHLHARHIVHQDLKPANIRLNEDDDPVVIDFGAARHVQEDAGAEGAGYGTEGYLPPELAAGGTDSRFAGKQRDVFALGRVILEMMVGVRLSQEQIFARKESLSGELLHSRTLPPEFARAVLRAVAYDPGQRYRSAGEMLTDLLSIAPPVGRVRPRALDFGIVPGTSPLRMELHAFNVGGGMLEGDVATDCPWLEVNASGMASIQASRFRRNRQNILVTAYPDRIRSRGLPAEGTIRVRFPGHEVIVPCRLERQGGVARVTPSTTRLRLRDAGDGWMEGRVLFQNSGTRSAVVRWTLAGFDATVAPDRAVIDDGAEVAVSIAVNTRDLEGHVHLPLEWHIDDQRQTPINLEAICASRRGWKFPLTFARRGR